jgi:hypothetical protein
MRRHTAMKFDNPDYVDMVIHSYRHRLASGKRWFGDGGQTHAPNHQGHRSQSASRSPACPLPKLSLRSIVIDRR